MPKTRKRKISVTASADSSRSSSKRDSSRTVIRRFHVLLKKQAQLLSQEPSTQSTQSLAEIHHEIESLGGLSAYQRMSSIGQGKDRGGGSEGVLISWLKELGLADRKGKERLKLLEVGALNPDNYASSSSWIEATPIDLRSRHPGITEQDMLLMDRDNNEERWDVVSLSLVVNFVPDAKDRGRMLAHAFHMTRQGGYLFLVLPLPCVENSRYMTREHLESLMKAIGFEKCRERWRAGGKIAYWLFTRPIRPTAKSVSDERFGRKVVLREGNRNNFCILF